MKKKKSSWLKRATLYALQCGPAFLFINLCLATNMSWGWFAAISVAWIITGAIADTAEDYRKELKDEDRKIIE